MKDYATVLSRGEDWKIREGGLMGVNDNKREGGWI